MYIASQFLAFVDVDGEKICASNS